MLRFFKAILAVLLGVSVLLACGCRKNNLTEDDFHFTVEYDTSVEVGKEAVFHCEFTSPCWMKVSHSSHLIHYEINGNRPMTAGTEIVEYFFKGQVIKKDIPLTFEEKGEYTVTFFSEFETADKEATEYRIQKEVHVTVQ